MLPPLEVVMGNEMLPKFFPTECKAGPAKGLMRKLRETLLTLDVFGFSNPKTIEQGEEEHRLLQGPLVLQGMSIKPRDVVAAGGKKHIQNCAFYYYFSTRISIQLLTQFFLYFFFPFFNRHVSRRYRGRHVSVFCH